MKPATLNARQIFSLVFVVIMSLFSLFPLYVVLGTSFRGDQAFQSTSLAVWGPGSNINNYVTLFTSTPFFTWLKNSLIVSLTVTLFGLFLAALSGYALSRFKLRGRKSLLFFLLATQMFPATMLLLPFTIILSYLKLMDSFIGLVIIYSATALPFCIWQMKSYYDTLPVELEDAARIDGCTPWQIFSRIIWPLSKPALVITGLFHFLSAWCEYIVAAVVLQNPDLMTLPLGLKSFQSSLSTQWGLYAAASLVVSLPVVVLFLVLSRSLISGMTLGSVKG